ncbi:MAG: helix-turn-helix transcriptional regulator [Clostridiales bacterium]|nr:helix-turn-helix transcriptional regulator [Clostridiales bacterium]
MPMKYKIDILAALKSKGYNTNRLRTEKLLSEGAIQALREKRPISWRSIEKICTLLDCQPGDVLIFERAE